MSIKSIAIIGVGGVGGFFGGKLCRLQESGIRVSFVARGEHLRAIQDTGLLLSSEQDGDVVFRPSLATDNISELPSTDLFLICIKEFDLTAILAELREVIDDATILLPLLNGMDVHSRIRAVIDRGIVLPACVYVGTHIERPGKVFQRGGACKILFGPDPQRPEFVGDEITQLFIQATIKSEWTNDIQAEIWKKFTFICAYGLVTAASGKTVGEVYQDAKLRGDVQMIMNEILALAAASGVQLSSDIVEVSLSRAGSFPMDAKTSFQRDFELAEKNDERELFAGAMLKMSNELGIDVPKTREISELLNQRKPCRQV